MKKNIHKKITNLPVVKRTELPVQNEGSLIIRYWQQYIPPKKKGRPLYPFKSADTLTRVEGRIVYSSAIRCEYCGCLIDSPHGNQRYHPECAYEVKKNRSKEQFAELKALKKYTILSENEAILKWLYYRYGNSAEFDRGYLLDLGFDFKTYSSIKVAYGFTLFFINRYAYYFLKNENIGLWKI
jgi:hypothetical protein